MKTPFRSRAIFAAICLIALLVFSSQVQAQTPPDLTAAGAIAALKADTNANPRYNETYNLGATGLRGWIYVGPPGADEYGGADGTFTDASRQILVTVAAAPGNAVLAVDDVILGAMAASSGTVPNFSSDCRKAFGTAIGDAEKTGAGTLRVKRWRAGTTTDVNIPITIMGDYTVTAPYSCPKSSLILTNARNKLVGQLLADPDFFNKGNGFSRPIHGLALLAGVAPGDPDYTTVQTRLQTYARATATAGPQQGGLAVWDWAYSGLFLAEYYLSTNDANVLPGIAAFTDKLVQSQSAYGTFGHDPARTNTDGTGRLYSTGYGPVNQVGIVANMAIFMGKKALLAGGQTINPNIDPAIQRGTDFFASYVNKGAIPYGEHEAYMGNHSSNGKDPMCAVFFSLQSNRTVETEYFTRMTIANFNAREDGHTGQGFSYLWGAMGANVGGSVATAEYLKNIRWHLDLSRRTDGSFVYDGRNGYGPGSTADGTYLGASSYFDLNPTASYILTYALPLQRLFITGKSANPANTLDSTKIANAVSAATFKLGVSALTNSQLITSLSEFDPVVRNYAAIELGKRSPSSGELTTLRGMITGTDVNGRMGACQTLGYLKDTASLTPLKDRLDKTIEPNSWVRAKAANAIREFPPATASVHRDSLLARFVTNATDPNVIDWDDPIQISNSFLGFALFGDAVYGWQINNGASLEAYTINAPKNLLYPAIQTGLKQPDSKARLGPATFCDNNLPLADVQALIPDFFTLVQSDVQADRMWGAPARTRGINILNKFKISEGIPLLLSLLNVSQGFEWDAQNYINPALNALETYGDAARWTLPTLNGYLATWDPQNTNYQQQSYPDLVSTTATIENAITAPAQNLGLAVANSQVVSTNGAKAITLTGDSPRSVVSVINVTAPIHGKLTGNPPYLTYIPNAGYTGPDHFTFQVIDSLGAANPSAPATVSIIVGTAGSGLKGEYFNNADFSSLQLTRTDAQVNFDWGTGSPHASIGADTFSARWSGVLLVPETGSYAFSTLNSDGVRLFVNGVAVIDQFTDQSTNWNDGTPIALTEGQLVEIQMDYYENTGSAVAKLKWTGPSLAGASGSIIGSQWLFDGTGMTRTPYAYAQSVSMSQNTSQPITLAGSGGTLTYAVLTQPAHGTLTGTAPNVTYTPAANYTGSDSFTFKVNNGTSDSAPATVSIGISAGAAVGYTWLNATSGNLSVAGNWTLGTAPAAAGLPTYQLNISPSGTYTVTHDLNNGFQLNQLNMAGAITLAGTNILAFTANGSLLPQLNQNSSSAVTVNTPLSLSAMTTFGGSGSGTVMVGSLISGTGGLTKNGPGTLQFNNASTANTYSGGTIINSGQLRLSFYYSNAALGTGPVTLNGGQFYLDRIVASNALTVNGGDIYSDNGFGNTCSGPVTLNSTAIVNTVFNMTFSGNISGAGGISKSGSNTLILSGNNSFTGASSVTAGILSCSTATSLGTGAFSISGSGKAALNYTGTRNIASLTLGGTAMPAGTYGSTASPATNKNDTWFTGTGTVTAGAPNTAPVAYAQSGSTAPNAALAVTLSATDAEANPLTYSIVTQPAHGALTGTPPNVTYRPNLHYTGSDSFTFKANDGNLDSSPATVTITVTGGAGNTAPVANAQSVSVDKNAAKPIFLSATDAQGNPLSYTIVTQPANGTLSGTAPNVTYTPAANYSGADSFTFKANDGLLDSAAATVSITVTAGSSGPLTWGAATAITGASNIQSSGVGNLAGANFGIVTGTTTTVTAAETGTVAVEFRSVGSGQNVTLANGINVAVDSQWANWGFNASNSVVSGNFGTVLDSNLGIEIGAPVSPSANITLSGLTIGMRYQIQFFADSTGSNSQTIAGSAAMNSLSGQFVTGTFTADATSQVLTVTRNTDFAVVNALTIGTLGMAATPPALTSIVDHKGGGPANTNSLVTYTVTFSKDMDASTVSAADFGNAGTSSVSLGTVSETSPGVFEVPVTPTSAGTLQLRINAGAVLNDSAGNALDTTSALSDDTTITVALPSNTAPVANTLGVNMPEDTVRAILLTGSDVDDNPLTYTVVTQPASGTLSGSAPNLTYNPAANFNGSVSFTFKVNDGTVDSAAATVSITVMAVNDAPVANAQSVSTAEDTAKAITLTATDVDGNSLTYTILTQPANGTLSGTAPNVTYTPAANYFGSDSFTFKGNDGTVDSAAATVSITVTAVNDPPVANAQGVSTAEDTAKAITLTGSDVEGGALTYTTVTQPAHGSLSGTAPNLTYTPAANYNGSDNFTFKVNDGTADSAPTTVSITVTAVNDPPAANPQSASTAYNTAKAITLAGTDVEGSALTYTVVTQPTRGTLSGTAPNVTYTPTSGTSGPDSFTFKVNDGTVDSATATVSITVALQLPWTNADIGTGMLAGSVSTSAGTFTQAGSGIIGSTSDKFNFLYQTLTGDGEIVARITTLQSTGTSSRVGVMIRDSLAANSMQIFMGMTGSNAIRWDRRTATGGSTTSSNSSTATVPNTWYRLVRSGTTITSYKSTNGTSWTTVGSTTGTTFASTCYIGLAVSSGSNTTLNTSQFSNVTITP